MKNWSLFVCWQFSVITLESKLTFKRVIKLKVKILIDEGLKESWNYAGLLDQGFRSVFRVHGRFCLGEIRMII